MECGLSSLHNGKLQLVAQNHLPCGGAIAQPPNSKASVPVLAPSSSPSVRRGCYHRLLGGAAVGTMRLNVFNASAIVVFTDHLTREVEIEHLRQSEDSADMQAS